MEYPPWEATGLGPFLPLLSSDIAKLVVLMRRPVRLSAGICPIRSDANQALTVPWSPTADFPETTKWQEVNFHWYRDYRSGEDHPHALVLMPSALERMGYQETKQTINVLWGGMISGDVLIIPTSNNQHFLHYFRRVFDIYVTFRFVKILGSCGKAYVCLGRNHQSLKLVSVQYHLQRQFINYAAPAMRPRSRRLHQVASFLGLYPWIEPEHILMTEKC